VLSLLLLLLDQGDHPRVLIDALLKIGRRSAASVAREAQVQPANLSRLRQESGDGQVSVEGQARLLRALGWSNGRPDLERIHTWVVRDEEDARAVEWLLKEKLQRNAQLREVAIDRQNSTSAGSQAWVGQLDEFGGYCSIIVDGSIELVQVFKKCIARCFKKLPTVHIPKDTYYLLTQGKLGEQNLEDLVHGKKSESENLDVEDQYKQLVSLGMSNTDYQNLVLHWLREQARSNPDALETKLSGVAKLYVRGTTIYPQAMTQRQRRKLVVNLASSNPTPL
jgi:hypothetical protein